MRVIAATNNPKKLLEMQRILAPLGYEVQSLADAGLDVDPEETGDTFMQNAHIKAAAVLAASGGTAPVVADDSGLVVDALGGAPGVYSARYAGPHGDDAANNQKLLAALAGVPAQKRTARFVSAVVFLWPDGRAAEAEGASAGVIGFSEKGEGGFGYDPLFYVGDKSYAQMNDAEKDTISHRGAALRTLADILKEDTVC